ncbi:MAG: response regulator, partial [Nostocaceae cyanobacterium]|nr:response regulator [Nostocaceae cyanobacterium]
MASKPKVNILLVDDHPENLLALEAILDSLDQNLVRATSGAQALKCLLNQDFAVILLDVQMPDMDGFETATLIRQRRRSQDTPIIFLTAFSTSETMVFKGYSLGAVDYLFKPLDAEILKSKVKVFVDLCQKTTEIAAMNAELKKSEEQFRSLSACSPVGIFLTDVAGYCTYTNPRYQAIWNASLQESLGSGWTRSLHPEDCDRVQADWSICVSQGGEYNGEFRLLPHSDMVRWVSVRSSPMIGNQGEITGYVGTVEDITERKQAEAERAILIREEAARKEAEAANRLKDEFLATLSHELRTPLNSILGWSGLLRTRKFDEATTARALETIERNATLQAQLIEDILDVSRIIRGKLRLNLHPVNLGTVIQAAMETVRPQAETKSINFTSLISNSNPMIVSGDSDRLQQIVWNLLTNAIKFTPSGGKVEVRLSSSDTVNIEVIDTGIGIAPEFLNHVFDRFRQADGSTTRSHGGLGLGLAIVRHLVELHNGIVFVESPGEQQGSKFTVKLPLAKKSEQREVESADPLPPGPTSHLPPGPTLHDLHILVVDDDT